MAGAIHKMAVYLGLVEDEVAYEDGYDSFEEDYAGYEDEEGAGPDSARQSAVLAESPIPVWLELPGASRSDARATPEHDL